MANVLIMWKGAVEPDGAGVGSGNEVKLWKGAVQPAYAPTSVAAVGGKTGPGLTFGAMGKMGST